MHLHKLKYKPSLGCFVLNFFLQLILYAELVRQRFWEQPRFFFMLLLSTRVPFAVYVEVTGLMSEL